ncbi:MAG TPA: hypothetical protein ENN19_06225 [Chloroflexi bacterium]|nr:hypothetical protein [Chloroflexota bacterium]
MDAARSLLLNWARHEPTVSLWLMAATALIFGAAFVNSRRDDQRAWAWGRCLIEALARALAFAALAGAFYFLLNSNYDAFSRIYGSFLVGGSLSRQNWHQWHDLYGGSVFQRDLQVTQYVTVERQETIVPPDPAMPPLYRNVEVRERVLQNTIAGFRGQVTIDLLDPAHQVDTFNAYTLSGSYEYEIVNPTDTETQAEFRFPLSPETKLYYDLDVQVDGESVSSWRVISNTIAWDRQLDPGEKSVVSIHYTSRGMEGFAFRVPEPREIVDFELVVKINTDKCWVYTDPENGGVELSVEEFVDETAPYRVITWTIERAIVAPRLRVYVNQYWPYAPYHEMIVTLSYAARPLLLFLSLAALTLLICGVPVSLRQFALLACLFTIPHLVLMAGGIPTFNGIAPAQWAGFQVKMLPILSILPLTLAFVALRRLARLPRVLTLVIMALFMAGYPFAGLLPDEQKRNALDGLIQAAMIAYVFGLALYVRVRGMPRPARPNDERTVG